MTHDPEKLNRVIGRYLAGEATDDEAAWLSARLGDAPEDLAVMAEALLVEAELIQLAEEGDLCAAGADRWWRRPGWISLLTAAAVVALAALVLSLIAAPKPEPFARWTPSPGGVVSVSGGTREDRELGVGSTLRVSQGCAEVVLREGVCCVLQAPGLLRLEAEGRVRLEDGVAWFQVEKEARGFEVVGPDLAVIDLGTEFGVDFRGEERGEVHVITGEVEVRSLGGRRETMRVTAGGAVALAAAGKLEGTLFRPALFVDELPAGIPALHFDFDGLRGGNFEARGSIAQRDGVRIAVNPRDTARLVEARGGRALYFDGKHFAVSNWPGVGGTSPRTVAFWIRLDPEETPGPYPILGWGNFQNPRKMSDFGIRSVENSGRLRIVSGRRWLEGGRSIAGGGWHHVVVVLGEHRMGGWPRVRLFIDGKEDALMPGEPWREAKAPLDTFWTDVHHDFSQPLTLGRFIAKGPQFLPGLRGWLDDLIVAEGVLTVGQVRALYEGRLEESGLDIFR